ncbi:AAA family ATPase [Sphingorhabdus lutea]|uniref:AAA family ATPase n=1 Tax=Sphingorhabdus lutea TaxID=1913578 RepID=A0A1L3JDC4_9SPHN|nr:YifB family Mg chelatase-like AAA ATPase [Sphingorhabdus lutea]APG63089.1 AAA family ATPase [Sphingorhabdus lutea]
MVAIITTVAFMGLEARQIEVQCQVAAGMPAFIIVGLPDKAVAESRERVRAALSAIGLALPPKRITLNLSPADLPKEGSHYDLPIAMALLCAMGLIDAEALANYVIIGELGLDGRIASSPGVLLAALHASSHDLGLICPAAQGPEAAWAGELELIAPPDLLSLLSHLKGEGLLPRPKVGEIAETCYHNDLKQVKGQETAKRILEIAAAGGHNMLMNGPPGAGKSLLASCLPGILPELTPAEALEVSMIASISGNLEKGRMSRARPFRAPHHSASMPALVGGGLKAKPGEVSLAHLGVLFLDELPEFQRTVLDSLRQPVESGEVTIARANNHISYPARFQLIAAMNPCRCGHLADAALACSRAPKCASDYQAKISGPMLDRIDLHIEIEAVSAADLVMPPPAEGSAGVKARVVRARALQTARYANSSYRTNAEADGDMLEKYATPDKEGQALLHKAAEAMKLSARSYTRVLRVARTIADLSGDTQIGRIHIAEALSYRRQAPKN